MKHQAVFDAILGAVSALVVVFFACVCALGGRETQNIMIDKGGTTADERENVFEAFKREREQVRQLEIKQLLALSADEAADEGIRSEARRQLIALTENMEDEATIEGLLALRGHADAVVTVHSGSVNVVIKSGEDNKTESAFILDLVLRETGQTGGNVKIMTVDES